MADSKEVPIESILKIIRQEIRSDLTDPNLTHRELRLVREHMAQIANYTLARMQLSAVLYKLAEFEQQLDVSNKYATQSRPEGHKLATTWELQNIQLKDILVSLRDILQKYATQKVSPDAS